LKRFSLGRMENSGFIISFVVLFIFLSVYSPHFLTTRNLLNVATQSADVVILAIAQTFVILTAGIDLSIGSVVVMAAYFSGKLLISGVPMGIALVGGLAFGGIIGLINGLIITKGGVTPFVATLGMMSIGRGLIYVYSKGLPTPPINDKSFIFLSQGKLGLIPFPLIIVIVVAVSSYILLRKTTLGRHIYAIGSNIEAAKLAGIPTTRVLIIVYAICGLLAALSGILLTARLSSANASLGSGAELMAIAAVVIGGTSLIGGKGGVIGSLMGAYMLAILLNGFVLLNIYPYWQTVVTGVIVILALMTDQLRRKRSVAKPSAV
jgi:ribose transport system permease protein